MCSQTNVACIGQFMPWIVLSCGIDAMPQLTAEYWRRYIRNDIQTREWSCCNRLPAGQPCPIHTRRSQALLNKASGGTSVDFPLHAVCSVRIWLQKSGIFWPSMASRPTTLFGVERTGVTQWKSSLSTSSFAELDASKKAVLLGVGIVKLIPFTPRSTAQNEACLPFVSRSYGLAKLGSLPEPGSV
jgi:hypothetical protein